MTEPRINPSGNQIKETPAAKKAIPIAMIAQKMMATGTADFFFFAWGIKSWCGCF